MTSLAASWPGISPRITSRILAVGDLNVHILEAKPTNSNTDKQPPLLILLHGFPELAYSWRKVIVPLADAGFHVVAPDQRGYGRTTVRRPQSAGAERPTQFDDDLSPFRLNNLVSDVVNLVYILGYTSVPAVIGHDYGSSVAGLCALIRPDMFKSVVMMSAPLSGISPSLVTLLSSVDSPFEQKSPVEKLNEGLAGLDPPRKHYTVYFSTREANEEMASAPRGLRTFLRAYYHMKSADWDGNKPYPFPGSESTGSTVAGLYAKDFAILPHYYVMPLHESMPRAVEAYAPTEEQVAANKWLTEEELAVYVGEYERTGFQGGLNRYRCLTSVKWSHDLLLFAGKRVEVPAMFLSGKQDWGVYQYPGAAAKMKEEVCTLMDDEDFVLVDGAGHWVQMENPEAVVDHLLRFLGKTTGAA